LFHIRDVLEHRIAEAAGHGRGSQRYSPSPGLKKVPIRASGGGLFQGGPRRIHPDIDIPAQRDRREVAVSTAEIQSGPR
jgi:hypothetical protein